jgi:hypothetical protein
MYIYTYIYIHVHAHTHTYTHTHTHTHIYTLRDTHTHWKNLNQRGIPGKSIKFIYPKLITVNFLMTIFAFIHTYTSTLCYYIQCFTTHPFVCYHVSWTSFHISIPTVTSFFFTVAYFNW